VLNNINILSKALFISGIILIVVIARLYASQWIEVLGFALMFGGVMSAKNDILDNGSKGSMWYNLIMVILLLIVFVRWFLMG